MASGKAMGGRGRGWGWGGVTVGTGLARNFSYIPYPNFQVPNRFWTDGAVSV